jgi:hypothetical protein
MPAEERRLSQLHKNDCFAVFPVDTRTAFHATTLRENRQHLRQPRASCCLNAVVQAEHYLTSMRLL